MANNQKDKTPEQIRAELRWALVCERLGFVLDPPPGASPEGAKSDLAAALENARAALDELQIAFRADARGRIGAIRNVMLGNVSATTSNEPSLAIRIATVASPR